jgi:hypothetical protein
MAQIPQIKADLFCAIIGLLKPSAFICDTCGQPPLFSLSLRAQSLQRF